MMDLDKRCSSCILPTSLPGLTLDDQGACNYCRNYSSQKSTDISRKASRENFRKISQKIKGSSKYDCLVPLSGGKDSSFILYTLIKEFKLRPLAFNFDNGFQHPQARKNIETLVTKLGVDLLIYKPDPNILNQLFRAFLLKAGEFCTPCNMLIDASGYRIARQNGIRFIMSGSSDNLDPGLEAISSSRYYDQKYYFEIADGLINENDRDYYVGPPYFRKAFRRIFGKGPFLIDVRRYLQPGTGEVEQVLSEIGWQRPADAIQHGDCLLNPIKEHMYFRKWGCNEVTSMYSSLVRNGTIGREEGLKLAQAEEFAAAPEILPDFLKTIGVSNIEFEEALKKDFHDIPNMRSGRLYRWGKKSVSFIQQVKGQA